MTYQSTKITFYSFSFQFITFRKPFNPIMSVFGRKKFHKESFKTWFKT